MLSVNFPQGHIYGGCPTGFEQKIKNALSGNASNEIKLHTIRLNVESWEKRFTQIYEGKACLSLRVWVGKPYGKESTQREIARLTREDGISLQKLVIDDIPLVDGVPTTYEKLAENDGLSYIEWYWFFARVTKGDCLAVIQFTNFKY